MPLRPQTALCLTLAMFGMLGLTGCKGCRTSPIVQRKTKAPDIDELEKKKKEKEKPKEDFEFRPPRVLPDEEGDLRAFVKPGHWITVRNFIKANNFDFQAELHTKSTDSMGRPLRVENTEFQMQSSRPAPLPKGQEKVFDTTYFIPFVNPTDPLQPKSVWLARELRAARGGRQVKEDIRQATVPVPAYQYYAVVLATEPDRYAFLKPQYSFQAPTALQADTKVVYYRIYLPVIDRVAPLPSHALTWTSIAYLFWDDMRPGVLTSNQQQAMVDWLYWGGQLVISGPNTLEKMKGSFLDPYLPAKPGSTVEVSQSSLDEMNDYWSLPNRRTGTHSKLAFPPGKPLIAVELNKHPEANSVPNCGDLLVERRIGNGRIVVTAFSLNDTRFSGWASFDNFMNGAILRRPGRDFRTVDSMPDTIWAGYDPVFATDARLSTTLRYFTRDTGHFSAEPETAGEWEPGEEPLEEPNSGSMGMTGSMPGPTPLPVPPASVSPTPMMQVIAPSPSPKTRTVSNPSDDGHFRGFPFRRNTGMAAWNDRSGPSDAAREALKDAAGISIPKGDFVLKVLAVYLAVLAPLNWLVFRAMGRVEWAWIAAPGIAILGTFAVVRLAQLDIGFARSTTEIGVVEMHGGFPRAHVTRYTALYTSLSTSYEMEFNDDGSLAQPFPTVVGVSAAPGMRYTPQTVTLRRDRKVSLGGFLVPSNTTRYLHCEQMQDMGGAFSLVGESNESMRLQNGTGASLRSAGVLRRTSRGELQGAWIGDLASKASVPLNFTDLPGGRPHFAQWDELFVTLSYNEQAKKLREDLDADGDQMISREEARKNPEIIAQFTALDEHRDGKWDRKHQDGRWDPQELLRWCRLSRAGAASLGQLIELGSEAIRLVPGEARLIGWTTQEVPGMTVRPAAPQKTQHTLFLVHLAPGQLPKPKRDVRLWSEAFEIRTENDEETISGLEAPFPPP